MTVSDRLHLWHETGTGLFRTLCEIYGTPDSYLAAWRMLSDAYAFGLLLDDEHARITQRLHFMEWSGVSLPEVEVPA